MAIVKTGTGQTPASGAANTGLAVGGAAVAGHTNEVLTHNGVKWVGKLPQLKTLTDVNIPTMTPAEDKSLLMYDHNTGVWVPNKTQYADKLAVEKAIDALVSGLSHDVAVIAMQKDPPGTPVVDEYYIVDAAATGDWTGHTNSIAHYVIDHDAGGNEVRKWVFVMPQTGEAHMVEDQKATYAWNGTAWVKVASATSSKLEDLGDVDATKTNAPKKGDILRYDGTKWTPYGAHRTFSLPATGRAGDPLILDFGHDKWTRAEVEGELRVAVDATHVSINLGTAAGVPALTAAMANDYYCQLRYGNTMTDASRNMAQWLVGNNPGITWLTNVAGSSDRISATTYNNADIKLIIQFMDDYMIFLNITISYWSYGATSYNQWLTWKYSPLAANVTVQKLMFYPSTPATKLGFCGRVALF